jgi:hypothetical protein
LSGQDNTKQRHAEQQPDAQHRAMIALLYVQRHHPPVWSGTLSSGDPGQRPR